ncbi:MAG: hypothetical protein ACFFDX_15990 [Candidatus Odinarchaeota archaeon]
MILNQLIILIIISFGLIIVSIIAFLCAVILELKEKSDEYLILIILLGILITFLMPVSIGLIREIFR